MTSIAYGVSLQQLEADFDLQTYKCCKFKGNYSITVDGVTYVGRLKEVVEGRFGVGAFYYYTLP